MLPRIAISTYSFRVKRLKSSPWTGCPAPCTIRPTERGAPITSYLPPAGRLEAVVTGPAAGTLRRLISRCVDTGPDGDPNPAMVLADIVQRSPAKTISKGSE